MDLTDYERETMISFNEYSRDAMIYTYDEFLKRQLAEYCRRFPELCRMVRSTADGSVTYEIDKSRMAIRFIPPDIT